MTNPTPLSPDAVNAIVRDMDDPRYPTQVGIFCDTCHRVESAQFMVTDDMDRPERAELARAEVRTRGWRCDDEGDFCPEHADQAAVETGE
jgi:hypothetical protein